MIQINLLPDVKQEFMRARRQQRTMVMLCTLVAGSAFALFVLLFLGVHVWQSQRIKNLTKDINKMSTDLRNTQDLNRVLTVQQQLKALPDLHAKKPAAKRLPGFLAQVTPTQVTIASIDVDFSANTITLSGSADKIETVNKFVDTFKFTKYQADANQEAKPAFSNVVLSAFGINTKGATYSIGLVFDPAIFDAAHTKLALVVPQNFITTRSETERPSDLFQALPTTEKSGGNQ